MNSAGVVRTSVLLLAVAMGRELEADVGDRYGLATVVAARLRDEALATIVVV
jgi:hypothetical protein